MPVPRATRWLPARLAAAVSGCCFRLRCSFPLTCQQRSALGRERWCARLAAVMASTAAHTLMCAQLPICMSSASVSWHAAQLPQHLARLSPSTRSKGCSGRHARAAGGCWWSSSQFGEMAAMGALPRGGGRAAASRGAQHKGALRLSRVHATKSWVRELLLTCATCSFSARLRTTNR